MVDVVVVGASGFGREALDVLAAMRASGIPLSVSGVIDDDPSPVNLDRLASRGIPHLGTIDSWVATRQAPAGFVMGIGDPAIRRAIATKLEAGGHQPFTAIHPSAVVGTQVRIGEGAVICAAAVIATNVRLGRHVHVNANATIGHDSILEDFVSVNPAATISGEVLVGSCALVGAGSIILQNLVVGESTTLGAGCLVTRNVPGGVVVKGVPGSWATREESCASC